MVKKHFSRKVIRVSALNSNISPLGDDSKLIRVPKLDILKTFKGESPWEFLRVSAEQPRGKPLRIFFDEDKQEKKYKNSRHRRIYVLGNVDEGHTQRVWYNLFNEIVLRGLCINFVPKDEVYEQTPYSEAIPDLQCFNVPLDVDDMYGAYEHDKVLESKILEYLLAFLSKQEDSTPTIFDKLFTFLKQLEWNDNLFFTLVHCIALGTKVDTFEQPLAPKEGITPEKAKKTFLAKKKAEEEAKKQFFNENIDFAELSATSDDVEDALVVYNLSTISYKAFVFYLSTIAELRVNKVIQEENKRMVESGRPALKYDLPKSFSDIAEAAVFVARLKGMSDLDLAMFLGQEARKTAKYKKWLRAKNS